MAVGQLEGILEAVGRMQSGWNESTELDTMRADLETLFGSFGGVPGSRAEAQRAGGVAVDCVSAPGADAARTALLFHGGGFSTGSSLSHRHLAEWISSICNCQVLVPDYRLVPEHVYPAQLEDARSAYDWLLAEGGEPTTITLMGDSAGGGLTLSLLAHLRESGAPLPACACLMSPWLDLRCRGQSYVDLADQDPIATHDMALGMGLAYVGPEGDLDDPQACPIDMDFSGLPPLLIQAGSREIFLDDARSAAAAAENAGVTVELRVWQDMIHQWHIYAAVLDEARQAIEEQADFLARHWR